MMPRSLTLKNAAIACAAVTVLARVSLLTVTSSADATWPEGLEQSLEMLFLVIADASQAALMLCGLTWCIDQLAPRLSARAAAFARIRRS
jgi:hypothetical protein